MNIKLLTFDLDHTLWAPEEALKRAEEKMHAWLNKHHPKVAQLYSPQAFLKYRLQLAARQPQLAVQVSAMRTKSEERRVGKECRSRMQPSYDERGVVSVSSRPL